MFYILARKQSAISETYGNNTRMRETHRFEIRTFAVFTFNPAPPRSGYLIQYS